MNPSVRLLAATALSLLAAACATEGDVTESGDVVETAESEAALELAMPPGHDIPGTGTVSAKFKPVDDAIRRFMDERCIGATVIGVGYKGSVLHNRAFGYKKGPPNAGCATASDPFVGGTKMGAADPIRVGSNSKAILAAVLRKELKEALSAKRGGAVVTDADLEALKLVDNGEIDLVAPRVRAAMLANGPGNPGDITSEPCVPKAWSKVTLGMLLTHTAGLGSSESAYPDLSAIRSLDSALDLAAQESASGAPSAARTALKNARGANAYFVPRATLEEVIVAQGNRCFAKTPGTAESSYSNGGFTLLGYVLEYVTGRSFVAPNGEPNLHLASLMAELGAMELGSPTGIEHSHTVLGKRDVAEPAYRHWSGTQSTYYYTAGDDKRPWCILSGGACSFQSFEKGATRFDWNWQQAPVNFTYVSNSAAPGTGALAVEAPKMLAFMNKYTVGKPYGGERAKYPGGHQHFGGMDGAVSWAIQMGGGTVEYPGFGKNRDGSTNFEVARRNGGSCVIPAGIDVTFTMNQSNDAACTEANGCRITNSVGEAKSAYSPGYYSGVVLEALCSVDWTFPPQ